MLLPTALFSNNKCCWIREPILIPRVEGMAYWRGDLEISRKKKHSSTSVSSFKNTITHANLHLPTLWLQSTLKSTSPSSSIHSRQLQSRRLFTYVIPNFAWESAMSCSQGMRSIFRENSPPTIGRNFLNHLLLSITEKHLTDTGTSLQTHSDMLGWAYNQKTNLNFLRRLCPAPLFFHNFYTFDYFTHCLFHLPT